jgi:hypothetical protein
MEFGWRDCGKPQKNLRLIGISTEILVEHLENKIRNCYHVTHLALCALWNFVFVYAMHEHLDQLVV